MGSSFKFVSLLNFVRVEMGTISSPPFLNWRFTIEFLVGEAGWLKLPLWYPLIPA